MATLFSLDIQFKEKKKESKFLCLNIVTNMSVQIFESLAKGKEDEKINGTLNRNCCKGKMTCKTTMNQKLC